MLEPEKSIRPLAPVILGIFLLLGSMCSRTDSPKQLEVVDGSIQIPAAQITGQSSLPLEGRWYFNTGKFLDPNSWTERLKEKASVGTEPTRTTFRNVPGSWARGNETDPALPTEGYASYAVQFLLPRQVLDSDLSIQLPTIGASYRLYLNGRKLTQMGEPDASDNPMTEALRPRLVRIPQGLLQEKNELLVHIRNNVIRFPGFWNAPELGATELLEKREQRSVALALFLVGGLALIGIYHLGLYLARSKESAPLYFALYCLSIATWSAQSGQKLFSRIIDGLSGGTAIRIEYMGLYLGVAAFLQFAGRLYPGDMPIWPKRILVSIALLCGLSGLILPLRFFIATLPPMQIVTLMAVGLCIYWTFQSVRQKRLGAYSVGLSLLILAITVTNDVLVAMAAIDGIYLAPYGLMIFIVGQSFALSMRLANAFNELEGLSRDLERRVQERTDDLDSLNELTRVVNEHQQLDYIVGRTSQFMVDHLGMRRMFFFLIDKKENAIRGNGGQIGDLPEEERQFFIGLRAPIVPELGTLYRTIQKKKTLYLDFRRTRAPESVVDRLVVEKLKMTSVVEIPAIVGEEVLGIAAIDPGDRKPSRDDLRRLEAVVAQISGAVQKQLYLERIAAEKREAEELRSIAEREREESELLAELGREINRGATIEELLSPIGRVSQSRLGANSLALYLPDEHQNLVLRAGFFRGEVDDPEQYPEAVQCIPLNSDASALPQVFHRKRASFMGRVDANALRAYAIDFALYEFWKYDWVALLPLLLQDRSIGLIAWSGPASNRISRKDLPFLKRVAETITGAVENLRLLEQVREKQILADRERRNNEVLAGLSRRAIEGQDINDIVFAMREAMQDLLGRHGMAVYLPNSERTELAHVCVIREGAFVPIEEIPEFIRTFALVPESGSLYWSFQKARSWYMPVINRSRVERSPIDMGIQEFFGFYWCYHIPLVVNDEAIGIVTLAGRDKVSLQRKDRELLERMVAQVAGAIRMQQLLQTIEKEKDTAGELQREARALADFTRLLNQRTDLRSMVQEVCHFAVESLGLRGSNITVVNESAREFQSIGGYGKDYGEQQHIFVRGSRVPMNGEAGLYQATYSRKKTIHMRRIPANAGDFNGLLAEMFGLKSFALVPLILEDQVIGIMGIDPGEHRLSKEDLSRLEVYADQVAGAINNANLMQQVEEQRSSIEGLAEISRMAASTDNLEEILDQIFAFVHRRYDIASGIIMLPDSEGRHLITYKAFSFEDMEGLKLWDAFDYARSMKLPIGEEGGTLARTFLRGKPFYVPDAAKLNRSSLDYAGASIDREILTHLRYRSYFSLPMHVNGEPVALLNFTAYKDNFNLSRNARNELNTLADQLAGIIRARQLSDGLAREKQLVEKEQAASQVLAALARQANEGSDVTSILLEVASYAEAECGVTRMALRLWDPEAEVMRFHTGIESGQTIDFADAPDIVLNTPPGRDGGSMGLSFSRGRKMFIPQIKKKYLDSSPADRLNHEYFKNDWFLHVPLNMDGTIMGLISFVGQKEHTPGPSDRLLLERMASQVAGAIKSKQLLAEVTEERTESQALAELARRANEGTSLTEIAEMLVHYSRQKCGVETVCLLTVDPDQTHLTLQAAIFNGETEPMENVPPLLRNPPLTRETGTLYNVIRRARPLYLPRITAGMERRVSAVDRAIRDYLGFHWFMDVPVIVQGQVIGVLAFAGPEREELTEREKRFLERLTAQVAGAIHSKQLLDQVEKEKNTARRLQQETAGLNQLLKRIAPIEDLDEIMEHVMDYVANAYAIGGYSLYAVGDDEKSIYPLSVYFPESFTAHQRQYILDTPIPIDDRSGAFAFAYRRSPKYTYFKDARPDGLPEIEQFVLRAYDLKHFIVFPLMESDRVIGFLNITTYQDERLNREQLSQLSILSEHISGILRMNGLIRDVREQSRKAQEAKKETDILASLSRKANESTDLKDVSQSLFDYLRISMDLDDFCLFVMDEDSSEVYAAAWDTHHQLGEAEEWLTNARLKMEPDLGTLYRTYEKKKTTYIPRFVEGFSSPGDLLIVDKLKLTSVLQIPLIIHDKVIGFFVCGPRRTLRLSREEIKIVERFCNQVAGAVRATALLDISRKAQLKAEEARAETQALANLSRQANETTNLQVLSQRVFDVLRETLNLDNQGLFVVDDKDTELTPVHLDHTTGLSWDKDFHVPLQPDGGTLYKTWQRKKTTYLPRLPLEGAAEPDLEIVRQLGIKSVLQIPLIVGDRVVGIFACGPTRHISREEIKSAERYCQQIAGAVRVIALLQATQEAREDAVAAKEEAEVARAESDSLLENVLPTRVAKELKETGHVEPVYFDNVSVLFTDFVGFTTAAANMSPAELIQELDGCFSQFDQVSRRNNMEKLKTIGDAYMCAAGLPVPDDGHAIDACLTALEFGAFMRQMAEVKGQLGFNFWQIRIGIHSGPVTAGVIGQNKFAYDIWGDTVNTASRMESSGSPGMVNISGATYELVKDLFECEYRGKVKAKGKGEMDMYFVHRIKPELSADEDGLLPNAMFEMARTNLDLEEIRSLREEVPGSTGEPADSADNSDLIGQNANRVNGASRDQNGAVKKEKPKKHAGARPLSELDSDRQGW